MIRGQPVRALALTLVCVVTVSGGCKGSSDKGAPDGGAGAARVTSVTVVPAAKKDVQVTLDGLGSVAGFYTVNAKAQVDGRLDKVLFKEGQVVHKGEPLAQIDARPFYIQLHQAEGALARDDATLKTNQQNLERYKTLREQNLVPQQQVDDQVALVGQAQGAVLMDKAAVESARLNIAYANVVSPIDGIAGVRQIDPGNIVHAADATGIVVLTQIDPISVYVTLPQDDLPAIAEQMQKGALAIDVWSRDGSTKLGTGPLLLIDNQINQTTGTLRLKAAIPNPKHLLWPNQFVKAQLQLRTIKDALVIPAAAIQRGPDGTFTYVVNPDETASPHPVQVAMVQGDTAIVASGLNAGDQVVTEGQGQLRAGAKVKARPQAAPASPDAPTGGGGQPRPRGHAQGNKPANTDPGRAE
jgi:multidrug efflux system membrane fusion protein